MKGEKTGGRTQGTPNKLTKELRTVLKDLIFVELEKLPAELEKLEGKERIELLIKLLPFAMPKLDAISFEVGEPFTTEW
jgi:hypothetical protein